MLTTHSFHIPVMGIGFTIDTPLKVAHYGIDSVISLVDDILIEKIRKMYCGKYGIPYQEITEKTEDYRAKRITSYLNLVNELAEKKIEELKNTASEKINDVKEYFSFLPDGSTLKQEFHRVSEKGISELSGWLKENLTLGSIDVNIMTKVDRDNFRNGVQLPSEFNDAHAALRGYANSELRSSIVLSAGLNPRLYGYMENFEDFYPDQDGSIKKKIILKVSDYRSALIQGKFLAKKGLWVSEYRIESGLNCGGHAFATDGYLMGPILAEFRDRRDELNNIIKEIFVKALSEKERAVPNKELPLRITAQGGVGTNEEHRMLLDHYQVDSVGWGTPFLLVPEVVSIDELTLSKLADAKEEDLYLSNISPLGVPFNSLRGSTKDIEKMELAAKGRPGSSCPKEFIAFSKEFTEKPICTASRHYQYLKLKELDDRKLQQEDYQAEYDKIIDKSCICVGLGTSALIANELDRKTEGDGVLVCPGPNLAYFSRVMTLKEMIDHIYGRIDVITRTDRPHVFIKELKIYIDYLKNRISDAGNELSEQQKKYFTNFIKNLNEGITYYHKFFNDFRDIVEEKKAHIKTELDNSREVLQKLISELEAFSSETKLAS
jgi:hypothetical protein